MCVAPAREHYVMVVDDDDDIRETLQIILEEHGYQVETFKGASDALGRLRSGEHPCLILLDLMMPHMNGAQFYTEQQRDPGLAPIPVVVLSGDHSVYARTAALGVEGLMKPVELERLVDIVRRFCRT